jgi:hypothetical protein
VSSRSITRLSNPETRWSVKTDFLSPLLGLRSYRDFGARDSQRSVLQPPIVEMPKRRYCPVAPSQSRAFATWDLQYLGAHPASPQFMRSSIFATCLPLTLTMARTIPIVISHLATSQLLLPRTRASTYEASMYDPM